MKLNKMTCPFEIKEATDEGYIEGYASTFGNIDSYGDVVDPGAFKKSIKDNKGLVPILSNHDSRQQIGWNVEASEDQKGLWVRGKLDLVNNAKAREHFGLIKMATELKAKPGLSIGYYTIKAEPDKTNPTVRRLKEVRLVEYSPVTFPANDMATVISAKEFNGMTADEACEQFMANMKQHGFDAQKIKAFFSALRDGAAATHPNDPGEAQSIEASIKNLTTILRG
jgi:HK97 family phage prohead protease